MSRDIRLATVDARGLYEIPRCGSRVRSTDVEKLRERAASTESLAAVARRNQARRTVSRPPGSLTPRRRHYLQGRLSRRDPFCTESIRGGIDRKLLHHLNRLQNHPWRPQIGPGDRRKRRNGQK
jgi:hypothetical protein